VEICPFSPGFFYGVKIIVTALTKAFEILVSFVTKSLIREMVNLEFWWGSAEVDVLSGVAADFTSILGLF